MDRGVRQGSPTSALCILRIFADVKRWRGNADRQVREDRWEAQSDCPHLQRVLSPIPNFGKVIFPDEQVYHPEQYQETLRALVPPGL